MGAQVNEKPRTAIRFLDTAQNTCIFRVFRSHAKLVCEAGAFQLSKQDARDLGKLLLAYSEGED